MKYFKLKILSVLLLVIILNTPLANAASVAPEILYGQTVITNHSTGDIIGYGSMTGNYAVINTDNQSTYGFNTDILWGSSCTGYLLTYNPYCFVLGTGLKGANSTGNGKLMNSRTVITYAGAAQVVYELPALYFGGVNVFADGYSNDDYLNNFSFWNRSLAQSAEDVDPITGATWRIGQYVMNPEAQSVWSSVESESFVAKAKIFESEAQTITDLSTTPWFLQGRASLADNASLDKAKFPNGKAWVYDGDLTLTTDKTTSGVGTLIVHGDLIIESGVDITKNAGSSFGLIVFGNVTFAGNNKIEAAIIAVDNPSTTAVSEGNITIGDDVTLTGSYVAYSFPSLSSRHNVNIFYDYKLDSAWPPGFKYLKMPSPEEIGNR